MIKEYPGDTEFEELRSESEEETPEGNTEENTEDTSEGNTEGNTEETNEENDSDARPDDLKASLLPLDADTVFDLVIQDYKRRNGSADGMSFVEDDNDGQTITIRVGESQDGKVLFLGTSYEIDMLTGTGGYNTWDDSVPVDLLESGSLEEGF